MQDSLQVLSGHANISVSGKNFVTLIVSEENSHATGVILNFEAGSEAIIPSGCVIEKWYNKEHLQGCKQIMNIITFQEIIDMQI